MARLAGAAGGARHSCLPESRRPGSHRGPGQGPHPLPVHANVSELLGETVQDALLKASRRCMTSHSVQPIRAGPAASCTRNSNGTATWMPRPSRCHLRCACASPRPPRPAPGGAAVSLRNARCCARNDVREAQIVATNHALLLSTLALATTKTASR